MLARNSLWLIALALVGCPSTTPTGQVHAWFGSDGEVEGTDRDSGSAHDEVGASGVVASLGAPSGDETWLVTDRGEAAVVLGLTAVGGQTYWAGWAAQDADGADLTPTPSLELGSSASLTYYMNSGWGGPFTGLTVTDDIGLVLAVEASGLGWGEYSGLTVSEGDGAGTAHGECGDELSYEVVFQGEGDPIAVEPGRSGEVQVDGRTLSVRVIEAYHLEGTGCADAFGAVGWVVWLP